MSLTKKLKHALSSSPATKPLIKYLEESDLRISSSETILANAVDNDTIYDDTEIQGKVSALESVVGDANTDNTLVKDVANLKISKANANHTHDDKVDVVTGKGLSTNDFDDTYKNIIDNLSTIATTGSYSDLIDTPNLEIIRVVDDKGTASEDTMNRLYIEVGQNQTDAYYTVEDDGSYSWEKFDEDILDDLSISWSDIQNKPSIPSKTSDLTNDSGFLTSHQDISGKANTNHTHTLSNITDLEAVEVTVTYSDDTTGTLYLIAQTQSQS